MKTHIEQADMEISKLERLIRETPLEVDLVDSTMERYINSMNMNSEGDIRQRSGRSRRIIVGVASVALVLTMVMGAGFISPTMAASMKQIPGISTVFRLAGDLGLRTADEKGMVTTSDASVTHEGLTLQVPLVMFDGTRVSLAMERQFSESIFSEDTLQEMISGMELSIDGESIQSYAPVGTSLGFHTNPGKDGDSTILQFSDMKNQGGKAFPHTFELQVEVAISGIQQLFEFNIPVEMNTENNVVLTPAISRKYGDIHLLFERIEITPMTTNLTTRKEVPENQMIAASLLLGYDIFDDKGIKLNPIGGNGWSATNGNVLIMDHWFEPFESIPQSITIKPYKHVYKAGSKSEFQLGADGHIKVDYIPELEVTLPTASK